MSLELGDWKSALDQAARGAKAEVLGVTKIKEAWHGLLVTTALRAFGDDPRALFFVEGLPPTGNIPRPDLILLHPDVGVLVIENKGVGPAEVHVVHSTALTLVRDGRLKEEDPFHQAERVMFRLRDLAAKRVDLAEALFLHTAALPRVTRDEFEQRFGTRWPDQTLFADACGDPAAFRAHVLGFSSHAQRSARRSSKLSKRAHEAVRMVLTGKGFLFAPRRTYIDGGDPALLGVQVQEMELAMKEATQQQKELGRADLRGHHRLFRGVAGSGKSIMLALSVAHTLLNYREEAGGGLFNQNQSRRVLVVCFNKTLVQYLRQRIDDRFGRLAWDKPPPEALTVTHFEGLVRDLEAKAPTLATGLTFKEKDERAKRMRESLDPLDDAAREPLLHDAVYVDEAQDLTPEEIRLLVRLARKDEKGGQTVVLFYDNAQNIYGVPTPVWSDLGVNIVGRTVFLDQCLRNTRQTLAFAFNVLVGSFAPEGERVTTRQFADVQSLRQRGLVEEKDGRFEIMFSPRSGPSPHVRVYPSRQAEIDAVAAEVRRLVAEQRVIPSDILVLYNSHWPYKDTLPRKLEAAVGPRCRVRLVDREHEANKKLPLMEDGVLTVSTIASAKGYDAPVVFVLGVDEIGTETQDRAGFYVGATRAKLHLVVTGMRKVEPSLLDEIVATARALDPESVVVAEPNAPAPAGPASNKPVVAATASGSGTAKKCRHCGGERLHAQHGKFGYFFRCIDCTQNTPIDWACPRCGKKATVRKAGDDFYRDCAACGHSALFHTNIPLASL